jgi:site-specific recombinase XerD
VANLQQMRGWFGAPLWELQPKDADQYFGRVLRDAAPTTRSNKAAALSVFFEFLQARHRAELYRLTGRIADCPLDEINRPRGCGQALIRVPPTEREIEQLFAGWRSELLSCRKFAPAARGYTAARLMSQIGLRIAESLDVDLADVKWHLGRYGKIHVRLGKGSGGLGPKERLVPLINGARPTLQWFVEDVWGHFAGAWDRLDAPLFPSERRNIDGTCKRVGQEAIRVSLADAVARHLPSWNGRLTPHVLRHYCASQPYQSGMDLVAIQELLGHSWTSTTMRYVHVQRTHIEDAWLQGQQRAAQRLQGQRS